MNLLKLPLKSGVVVLVHSKVAGCSTGRSTPKQPAFLLGTANGLALTPLVVFKCRPTGPKLLSLLWHLLFRYIRLVRVWFVCARYTGDILNHHLWVYPTWSWFMLVIPAVLVTLFNTPPWYDPWKFWSPKVGANKKGSWPPSLVNHDQAMVL